MVCEYVDPTVINRGVALLYQVDRSGNISNQKYRVLDLSDCNIDISHTLNNEVTAATKPGADAEITDTLLSQDDVMTLSFDIPCAAHKIYRDMHAFCKYGILADETDPWARYSEGMDAASQRVPERFYQFVWGDTFEDKMRVTSVGPDRQVVSAGVYIFPKSVTWDLKAGRKDFLTIRLTGLVCASPRLPPESNPLSLLNVIVKFLNGGYVAGGVGLGAWTAAMIAAFLRGETTTPGETPEETP